MKNIYKVLFITSSFLLVAGAGCTQTTTTNLNSGQVNTDNSNTLVSDNTNTASTNDAAVENTNSEPVNENTNTDQVSEVDTSDWLTYTNEEYGFSCRYPSNWNIDVINEDDEGGMGTNLGTITMNSEDCQVFVDNVLVGTINNQKAGNNKTLLDIESTAGVQGISFFDAVNENGSEGIIYIYKVNDGEIRFIPVSNPSDPTCSLELKQIVSTLDIVS